MGAGAAEGAVDASNMLKPALARGELRCIGATTLDEYRKYIEKDKALERRFQPIFIGEPSVEDTIAILRGLKEKYEVHHGVRIKDSALIAAATLSCRYITERFLPDKAIDLVDEAASRLRIEIDSLPTEIDQIDRRIMNSEKIPHDEKIFSVFEEHTERISKGKAGKPVELGLRVSIVKDQFGFILHHMVHERQTDDKIAVAVTEAVKERYDSFVSCSFDRGYYTPDNKKALKKMLNTLIMPKKGGLSKAEKEEE